jgi:hypothetical protein
VRINLLSWFRREGAFEVARWELQVVADTVTKATFIIDADLNMMMKMIASTTSKIS